jgi:hypothetical protein
MRRYWRRASVPFVSVVLASGFLAGAAAASGDGVVLGESDSMLGGVGCPSHVDVESIGNATDSGANR